MVTHVCRREFCGRTQIWCWDCSGYASANVCTCMRVCFPKGVISPLISPGPPSLVCRGQWPGWTAVMQFVSGWEFSASFKYWGKKRNVSALKHQKATGPLFSILSPMITCFSVAWLNSLSSRETLKDPFFFTVLPLWMCLFEMGLFH